MTVRTSFALVCGLALAGCGTSAADPGRAALQADRPTPPVQVAPAEQK